MQRSTSDVIPPDDLKQYEGLFDPKTGLPRWALLLDRTDVALARAQRMNRKVAVFVLDDVQTLGGAVPDMDRFVASLRSKLRSDDTIARVAERTFVIICNNIGRDRDAALVAQRLVQDTDVVCRFGIALSGGDDDASSLLTNAVKQAVRTPPA